jgi:hypothetical protein
MTQGWMHSLNRHLEFKKTCNRLVDNIGDKEPCNLPGEPSLECTDSTKNSGDLSLDPEGNHAELCQKIVEELATVSTTPVLLCETDPAIKAWPGLAEHVKEWMNIGELIAVGCHRQVLEDVPEVYNSEMTQVQVTMVKSWKECTRKKC